MNFYENKFSLPIKTILEMFFTVFFLTIFWVMFEGIIVLISLTGQNMAIDYYYFLTHSKMPQKVPLELLPNIWFNLFSCFFLEVGEDCFL